MGLVSPNLAGTMPDAWVHRQLKSGRALLLADGLDAVPAGSGTPWGTHLAGTFEEDQSSAAWCARTLAASAGRTH